MSTGLGITTILGCLASGEPLMNIKAGDWRAPDGAKDDLVYFLERQEAWRESLRHYGEELRSYATPVHADLVAKMAEWNVRLNRPPEYSGPAVYMLSQLREYLEWLKEGTRVNRGGIQEFRLGNVRFRGTDQTDEPVVQVATKKGDTVYMVRWDRPLSGFGLLRQIEVIEHGLDTPKRYYDGVQAPCVLSDLEPDLSWLLGMTNGGWFVAYAQQKVLFGMNELGFAQREETLMATRKGIGPDEWYILSPRGESFLFWRRRKDVEFPISMYQFTSGDFKNPGDLKKIVE